MAQVIRCQTIQTTPEGRLTAGAAAKALGLSRRQVERLKAKVRTQGVRGVLHASQQDARCPAQAGHY